MCGICGVVSTFLVDKEKSAFSDLMTVMTLRGRDGCGVIGVPSREGGPILREKTLSSGAEFVSTKTYDTFKKSELRTMIGHCRFPTKGERGKTGLHPHVYKDILGMHNGTMETVYNKKIGDRDSDSALLFRSIADNGVEKTFANSVGSYSLVWVDTEKKTLNFLKNKDRPLYFAYEGGNTSTFFFASEYSAMNYVLSRKGFKELVFHALPDNKHAVFPLFQGGLSYRELGEVPEGKKTTSTVPSVGNTQAITVYDNTKDTTYDYYLTLHGQTLRKDELEKCLNDGCCWCGAPKTMEDYSTNKVHFTEKNAFICDLCYTKDKYAKDWVDSIHKDQN